MTIIASIFFIVIYVRYFTEELQVIPRIFQLADKGLFILLIIILLMRYAVNKKKINYVNIKKPLYIYIFVLSLSFLLNFHESSFLYFITAINLQFCGVVFFLYFVNSDFTQIELNKIIGWIFIAAILQIIVGLFQLPQGFNVSPDKVSGTFGNNNSQMVFFIVTFLFGIFASYLYDKSSYIKYLGLPIIIIFLAASFRATWLALPISALFLTFKSKKIEFRKLLKITAIIMIFLFTIGLNFAIQKKEFKEFISFEYSITDLRKVRVFLSSLELFIDHPELSLFGTGPGTYGSRTYRLFIRGLGDETINPTAGIIKTSGTTPLYARQYLLPALYGKIFMSTIDSPYTSYLNNLVETGVLGFFSFFGMYFMMFSYASFVLKNYKSRMTFVLSLTLMASLFFLAQMALVDDWFGVERISIPLWMLFALLYKFREIEGRTIRSDLEMNLINQKR